MMQILKCYLFVLVASFGWLHSTGQKPNVVLILTDDQGYGDLACHGNPLIKTPNLDKLYAQGVRFTNYHVATTCAPTRAGLLTGRNCNKVGAWHTIIGRELLRKGEVTMAEIFRQGGYATGIFGKWHLGDNYPFRPQDRGFNEVLIHGGGGVTQTPDYWNNDYFDDTYFHNGIPEKYTGYCTNVWFSEAAKFITRHKKKPFFCYIATNAPHSPYNIADAYSEPYKNNPRITNPNFYGMITHLDEQVGLLIDKLKKEGVYENTIFMFMTDNGTAAGVRFNDKGELVSGYNAGMRGTKGTPYDGGHRVPFFLHWPKGAYGQGKNINTLTSYLDVLPTLMDLCKIRYSRPVQFDGMSLLPLLKGDDKNWPDRVLVADVQRAEFLVKWKQSAVMTKQWRLVNRTELYDIQQDPGQRNNLFDKNPAIVSKLEEAYEKWWSDVSAGADSYSRFIVGSPRQKVTILTSHDLHNDKDIPAWNQETVRAGNKVNGFWALEAAEAGNYEIELRRYPAESNLALAAIAPKGEPVPGGQPYPPGEALRILKGKITIGQKTYEKQVQGNGTSISFVLPLARGDFNLTTVLQDDTNQEWPAYYVYIKKL
jgi:arylsulfatase A-like enzyme